MDSSSALTFYLHSNVCSHAGEKGMELQLARWAFCITYYLLDLTNMPLIVELYVFIICVSVCLIFLSIF